MHVSMRQTRTILTLAASMLLLVATPRTNAAQIADAEELWYVIEINGEQAGWTRQATETRDGLVYTESETRLAVKRGPIEISVTMESLFVETEEGEPVRMSSTRALGSEPIESEYTFNDDEIEVRSTQSGRTTTRTINAPTGEWYTPAAAQRALEQAIGAGSQEFELRTADLSEGFRVVTVRRSNIEPAGVKIDGQIIQGLRCETVTSAMPGFKTIEFMTSDGVPLKTEASIMGMRMVTLIADEKVAIADVAAPELMESTFVTPSRVIEDPYRITTGIYVLRAIDGELPDIPTVGGQLAERQSESEYWVLVRATAPSEPLERDLATESLLEPSEMLPSDDPRIIELAERAASDEQSGSLERAEEMRRFVEKYVREKSLGVGFASAGEVARTREGDCTEHAVLLAAMLRADGYPARVVSGLIYADRFAGGRDIFAYHMWTQALIDTEDGPRWFDLDATRPKNERHGATHIALAVSNLADGAPNPLAEQINIIGNLEIDVLETTGGRRERGR